MQARARAIGGELAPGAVRGHGCRVQVTWSAARTAAGPAAGSGLVPHQGQGAIST
jgi:hypothetical protein